MSTRLRNLLGMVLAAVAAVVAVSATQQGGTAFAEGHDCPAGTNWDNSIHACR